MTSEWTDPGSSSASTSVALPPSPSDGYPVSLVVRYPEPGELSRLMLFVKWLLIIPHSFVLFFLTFGMLFATFLAWWAILFTGRYPRGLFDLVVGIQQWNLRANAYASLLVTDEYPPFSFGRPVSGGAIATVVVGILIAIGLIALYTLIVIASVVAALDPESLQGAQGFPTPRGGR